jgi:hypothetical protein
MWLKTRHYGTDNFLMLLTWDLLLYEQQLSFLFKKCFFNYGVFYALLIFAINIFEIKLEYTLGSNRLTIQS